VARALHDETGADAPINAMVLARAAGLELRPTIGAVGSLMGDVIRYDPTARHVRQHGQVAHELAHWALREYGEPEDDVEPAARYLAGALMLPRREFDRDLSATNWCLDSLRAKHLNPSAEMIARRITQLRDAVVTIFDQGRASKRFASPWMGESLPCLSTWERELADRALRDERTAWRGDLCYAAPVIDGGWRRVVLVCEAAQLGLRL